MSFDGRIAVLGGGSGGHTMAADLTLKGYEVNLCEAPEFEESFKRVLERQKVTLVDMEGNERDVRLNRATVDFEEAVDGVDYIMIAVPGFGRRRFFEGMMPYLKDGQTIVTWAGSFSALMYARMLRESGIKKDITLSEVQTLPWACRLEAPGRVRIHAENARLLVATLPSRRVDRVVEDLSGMYELLPAENVMSTSLNNLNAIVHPVGTLLNAGWVDTLKQEFGLYRHGTTSSVARSIKAVYEEVKRVAEALGVRMIEYPEESFFAKGTLMTAYVRVIGDKDELAGDVSGPSSMTHRYVSEDVPFGLVPISRLAHKFGVKVPIIDGIIALTSAINQTDYLEQGLSLEDMGIAGMDKDELMRVLEEGFGAPS